MLSTLIFSCNKDENEPVPFVPPVTTMSVDFSFLTSKKAGQIELTNWQYSTISLAVWNAILNESCAVPIVSFEKTIEQKAVALNSKQWEWINKFNTDSVTIRSRLTGKMTGDTIEWKLFISTIKQNITSPEYLWIEGKSAYNQTGGWWMIYEKPSSPNPFVRINWYQQNGETINRFIFVKPGDEKFGQYLEYGTKINSFFDAFYNIKIHNENTIHIELNKHSKAGRIKSEFLFNDTNWHCWDSSYNNTNCG